MIGWRPCCTIAGEPHQWQRKSGDTTWCLLYPAPVKQGVEEALFVLLL